MLLFLQFFACESELKPMFYDISSTVIVTDDMGIQLDIEDVEFCQRFQSEDYNTQTSWQVHSEQCETIDIDNGLAVLSNWEGEYFGPDVSIVIDMKHEGEIIEAELVDSDQDVWCDNEVIDSVDPETGQVTYTNMCDENYERYLLWNLVVPSSIDEMTEETEEGFEEGTGESTENTESNDNDDPGGYSSD